MPRSHVESSQTHPNDSFEKNCYLPEDSIEYSLIYTDATPLSSSEMLARYEEVRQDSVQMSISVVKDYIWHKEAFQLNVLTKNGRTFLHGLTNYGDSVEDEWLIVYLVKELSRKFPDLWVRVADNDGEFLLAEAANVLPRWLNPEVAENRIWIHKNKLYIIPLSPTYHTSEANPTITVPKILNFDEALQTITLHPEILINSPLIEEEAFYRLRNYPSQISDSMHYAMIYIPRKLAHILHQLPCAVSSAVESFYLRDPIGLKTLQKDSTKLIFSPKDLVCVSVRFSKLLFAQIKHQEFSPPPAWKKLNLATEKKELEYERINLGMKLTSGFEMLVQDPMNTNKTVVHDIKIMLEEIEKNIDHALPSDAEISQWVGVSRDDDESWIDIDFKFLEQEFTGKTEHKKANERTESRVKPGLGNLKTHEDLKEMVARFESFLNDDKAVLEENFEDMDIDNDDHDDETDSHLEESEDEGEDKTVSFDENEFNRMMREMMGIPTESVDPLSQSDISKKVYIDGPDGDEESICETQEIQEVMNKVEKELREAGILKSDATYREDVALESSATQKFGGESDNDQNSEVDSNTTADVDFVLAKNLLESLKAQAGLPGPAGNLFELMGIKFPQDDDEVK
ncbi:SGT1/ecdysoneless [Blumeria hordei DH14]|uniref:SGT1/ecdysoneless n=1 Tax=Blumeria graminis f. sp. hordei (strain DH14) TaxID=546991 RepID=N1JDD5_BLUG1|nr:SGT1/ecdysoneless [Blumeria hordei DH14]